MTVRLVCRCGEAYSAQAEDPKQIALAARSRGWRRREQFFGGPAVWECPTCVKARAILSEVPK